MISPSGQARISFSFFPDDGFSHSLRPRPIPSRHYIYMASPPTELILEEDTTSVLLETVHGEVWRRGLGHSRATSGPGNWVARALAGRLGRLHHLVARAPPKRRAGAARRRAPNATQTVVWRTSAPKVMENVTYFNHPEIRPKIEPREGAKNVTHSDTFGPRALLKASAFNLVVLDRWLWRKRSRTMSI